MDELKEEMNMNRRQNAIQSKASINGLTRLSIDGGYGYLITRQSNLKHRSIGLDAINFSQDLMREDYYQRLENLGETTMARLGMHQCIINNLQNMMHVIGVDKEI
ncbi:unnamed protein product, partial [Brassica rapa]